MEKVLKCLYGKHLSARVEKELKCLCGKRIKVLVWKKYLSARVEKATPFDWKEDKWQQRSRNVIICRNRPEIRMFEI